MDLSLDRLRIARQICTAADAHEARSILHVGVETGTLGACLREALDYAHGRKAASSWRARIVGLTASGNEVPFGACYDSIEAEEPGAWLDTDDEKFDLILAPKLALELARDDARDLLQGLYERTEKLLIAVVPNDLSGPHEPVLESLYTLQLLSADFARVRFSEIGRLSLAVIRNEFLPL